MVGTAQQSAARGTLFGSERPLATGLILMFDCEVAELDQTLPIGSTTMITHVQVRHYTRASTNQPFIQSFIYPSIQAHTLQIVSIQWFRAYPEIPRMRIQVIVLGQISSEGPNINLPQKRKRLVPGHLCV